ncbi:MucR family transcriptional regulator [Methylobacterium variabile]|uniref:MucR family transcriptional regulator n=1 Tax=Methylobacterium variabile TaxID=298794 RepID=UPI000ACCF9FB
MTNGATAGGRNKTGRVRPQIDSDTQDFLEARMVSLDGGTFLPICRDDSDRAGLLRSGWKLVSDVNLEQQSELVGLAADIVSSYVANNNLQVAELPGLIASVHASLMALGQPVAAAAEETRATPAQIRKSVTPDHLISFIDGKPYRSLKRHLTSQGLTPADYRQKFGLPHDYPMVAASYAAQRSALAKSLGLGQRRRDAAAAAQAAAAEAAEAEAAAAKTAADAPEEKPAPRRRARKAAAE